MAEIDVVAALEANLALSRDLKTHIDGAFVGILKCVVMALHAAQDKAAQTAKALGIQVGRVISVQEAPAGSMWGSPYFPQVANEAIARPSGDALGGTLQPLTLDVTIGFELARGT